ncbi:class I SAM-dependent methyltransferase [Bacillus sp. FJAT-45037]|uniref:class I SAM-dependent methyltransferase n=1 Tax=Bacillus sp. FJAT-45037 TaxID=2011007 RepID=UPI000C242AED|nr:class I SAM-dependent methyltransferase [Bacillus sp. FJAT-45037]
MNQSAKRFDEIANNFLNSEVHKSSPSIEILKDLLGDQTDSRICDVACGAGHLGLSFDYKELISVDPSTSMLKNVAKLAESKNKKLQTVNAYAEELPFPSEAFDVVMTRLAAHHFNDIKKTIQEMNRVLKPEGHVCIIDLQGYDDELIDQFNHEIEVLHDETHVKSYSLSHWVNLLENEGFLIEETKENLSEKTGGVSVKRWCEIASSGPKAEAAIRSKLKEAPATLIESLGIEYKEIDFFIPVRTVMLVAKKR